MVNQDEKKPSTGFNWDDYDPNKTPVHTAFVARVEEDSDDDTEYYAKR